ncbi:MAG: DUF488 domain-containing protein [Verrucomicrobia bacterium]|nr:MAG: DUF488 domain-containing protein [Verrucomicrobiota bacterium]
MSDVSTNIRIVTIGAYGFTAETFFAALRRTQVDTFCDLRYRRGVRGSEYAFANRQRLEQRLAELGIRYLHFRELAPDPALRRLQSDADKAERTTKRQRNVLSPPFVEAYLARYLAGFDSRAFIQSLGPTTRVAALFCVERAPEACHRSLVAQRLQEDLGLAVEHLLPE